MKTIDAIIETPKGSSEKYDYDPTSGFFKLKKILPSGMVFPYDFGFIPRTKGEDGDPIDILIFSEFKSFPGCMIECRLIGNIQAKQTDGKKKIENDRFVGIPIQSVFFQKIKSINDFPNESIKQLEAFFINYNKAEKKIFQIKKINGPKEAHKILEKQIKRSKR